MSLVENIVAATAGELILLLVKLSHPTWPNVLRYAEDVQDWTVTDEDLNVVTFVAMGVDADAATTDDSGVDERAISVPDPDNELWNRLTVQSIDGDAQLVTLTVYTYLSTDLTQPAIEPATFRMANPSRDGRMISFTASTVDVVNRDAPSRKFTWANSPGLRR